MGMETAPSALLSTAYFPPLSYLAQFLRFPEIVLEQWEHYQKGSYRNRARIATANGMLDLSVPLVKGKHQKMPIREVRVDYGQPWVKAHLDTLQSAYGKSPFYADYVVFLEPIFASRPLFLFDLNYAILEKLLKWWRIPTPLSLSLAYTPASTPSYAHVDLRDALSPKPGRAGAAMPGVRAAAYPQVFEARHGFVGDLSALDLLFCTGPEGILYLKESIALQTPPHAQLP